MYSTGHWQHLNKIKADQKQELTKVIKGKWEQEQERE